jgi:hypothetical protein
MKQVIAALCMALIGSVSGHGVLTKVSVNAQTACAVNARDPTCKGTGLNMREIIPRSGNDGQCAIAPGCEASFKCDWCGLEKVFKFCIYLTLE